MIGRERPGLALLMVLAVLVISASAALVMLRVGIGDQLGKVQHRESAIAAELQAALEPAVLEWLTRAAERVVLPPDATQPGVRVLDNELELGAHTARIEISAWDQAGMVTVPLIQREPAFAECVPRSVQAIPAELPDGVAGLDTVPRRQDRRVFPTLSDGQPAIGALVATHNPIPGAERSKAPAALININTAPLPVIEGVIFNMFNWIRNSSIFCF